MSLSKIGYKVYGQLNILKNLDVNNQIITQVGTPINMYDGANK